MRRSTDPAPVANDALDQEETAADGRKRRRRVVVAAVASVALVALFAAGWSAAQTFESPAQKAAHASAPAPGVVTATVADGTLERTLSATATVGRTTQETATVNAALASAVVTKSTVRTGATVGAGTVALEANGRPLFALPGDFPFYRPLTLGDTGPDVRQLQAGLAAAGYAVTADGAFGAATGRAVTALYERAGYSVPVTTSTTTSTTSSATDGTAPASSGSASAATPGGAADVEGAMSSNGAGGPVGAGGGATSTTSRLTVSPSELLTFSSLPADVLTVPPVGTILSATSAIGAESGPVIASAPVAASASGALRVGMTGVVTGPDGTQTGVSVTAIDPVATADGAAQAGSTGAGAASAGADDQTGSSGGTSQASSGVTIGGTPATTTGQAGSSDSTLRLTATGEGFPTAWLHQSGVAVITVSVAAEHSLIVPSIAVVSGAKGAAHVLRRGHDGTYVSVPVTEVGALDGKSAVRPSAGATLRVGDLVKVG